MATVKQILDRAADYTGLRKTGSERQLALDALEDVYLDVLTEVGLHEALYTHVISEQRDALSLQSYQSLDGWTRVADYEVTFAGVGDTQGVGSSSINPSGTSVSSSPGGAGTLYSEGTDYTINSSTGLITSLTITGLVYVSYFLVPTLAMSSDIGIPPFFKLNSIMYSGDGVSRRPLKQITNTEFNVYDVDAASASTPAYYTMVGTNAIRVFPRSVSSGRLEIYYNPMPPILSETNARPAAFWDSAIWDLSQWDDVRGAETTPSMVPLQFHWNTLLPGVVIQCLDKDQRELAEAWHARYEIGLQKIRKWKKMMSGRRNPRVFNAGRYDRDHSGVQVSRYNRGGA